MLIRTFRSSWEKSNDVSSANNNVRNPDVRDKSFIYKKEKVEDPKWTLGGPQGLCPKVYELCP